MFQQARYTMLLQVVTYLLLLHQISGQNPCPEIFTMETDNSEQDRWYGVIQLRSTEDLNGVWLQITLDRSADLLGNWFGEVTSPDNREFTIRNTRHRLTANIVTPVRFFVKYLTSTPVPRLTSIQLNGKSICPPISKPMQGTLHTSQQRPVTSTTTASSINVDAVPVDSSSLNYQTPGGITGSSDEEIYEGDYSPSRRPLIIPTSTSTTSSSKCGIVIKPVPLITHGQATSEGEYPWHVALYRTKGVDLQYTCGGSLISENHILTAAHCVTKPYTNRAVKPDVLLAYLGKYNLKKFGNGVQDIQANKITVHPEYNASRYQNDMAILHLSHPAEITDYVRPVCLWEEGPGVDNILNRLGTVVGWGLDENGQLTEQLMQAKMPIVTTETCIFSNPDFFSRFTSSSTFCASFRNGTSACTGDSGGGMVFPKNGTRGTNTIWQLRGVVSLSAALQHEKVVCDTSNYIIFSDVAKHIDWINSVVNNE